MSSVNYSSISTNPSFFEAIDQLQSSIAHFSGQPEQAQKIESIFTHLQASIAKETDEANKKMLAETLQVQAAAWQCKTPILSVRSNLVQAAHCFRIGDAAKAKAIVESLPENVQHAVFKNMWLAKMKIDCFDYGRKAMLDELSLDAKIRPSNALKAVAIEMALSPSATLDAMAVCAENEDIYSLVALKSTLAKNIQDTLHGELWKVCGKPLGHPDFGRAAFHHQDGKCSTAKEKQCAINEVKALLCAPIDTKIDETISTFKTIDQTKLGQNAYDSKKAAFISLLTFTLEKLGYTSAAFDTKDTLSSTFLACRERFPLLKSLSALLIFSDKTNEVLCAEAVQNQRSTERVSSTASSILPSAAKAAAALPAPTTASVARQVVKQSPSIFSIISAVKEAVEKHHPFEGYSVKGLLRKEDAASYRPFTTLAEGGTEHSEGVMVRGIGNVSSCHIWTKEPLWNLNQPTDIEHPIVRLPEHLSLKSYEQMRMVSQQAVVNGKGIDPSLAERYALDLRGVVIEATMPYKAATLLQDAGQDTKMHMIFQTGLNFAGKGGGGYPVSDNTESFIGQYYTINAQAAVDSALFNGSNVLVFNIGIGAGFFAGKYGEKVKQANVDGIINAVVCTRASYGKDFPLQVVVPNAGLSPIQRAALQEQGITIISGDKDAAAALFARALPGQVSQTIAADPMSMLGIHGPGLWWETAGSASDEERAAFLTPCYALGYIPLGINFKHPEDIKTFNPSPRLQTFNPASQLCLQVLSQFMRK